MCDLRRLLVVSHVLHYEYDGRLYAYGPYAREIEIWAELFPEIIIAAPVRHALPSGDALAFQHPNISMAPQRETGGTTLLAKLAQALAIPGHLWRLARAMHRVDAIQVRCPGNLGLLGCLLAPFFDKPRVAKYASQWNESPEQPFSWLLQKAILRSQWWGAPVLVYGDWPNQPRHIVPFFTSILDDAQMARARTVAPRDWTRLPLEVLFVGRLSAAKNVDVVIRSLAHVRQTMPSGPTGTAHQNDLLHLRIVGDGPLRAELEQLSATLGIVDCVRFEGAVPQARVLDFYEKAHVLVLASQTEGWPKAIAEGMAFGLVCIGSNRGLVPQMLSDGKGLLVEPGDISGLANVLGDLLRQPTLAARTSRQASAWAQQFTLESFGRALRRQLETSWKTTLRGNPAATSSAIPAT